MTQIFKNRTDILLDRARLRAYLNDIYLNDVSKVNVLLTAYDIGIVEAIERTFPMHKLEQNRFALKLKNQYSIQEDKAEWAVSIWINSIDRDVLNQLKDERTKELEEKPSVEVKTPEAPELDDISENITVPATKEDSESYYVNVSLPKDKNGIFIPCGVGKADNGFFIRGVTEANRCTDRFANIYALVYNYLMRNSKITEEDKPHYLNKIHTKCNINYRNIFRLEIILLQLIKNNCLIQGKLDIRYDGDPEELKLAVDIINDYAALFCRFAGINNYIPIRLTQSNKALKVSLTAKGGVYIVENNIPSNARELWTGRKINYKLSKENLRDLEYLLREISPFDSFKEGQFESLKNMLSADGHSVCIMPTGSGKSLIFYMISLLQPLPIFVVAPTEILIQDQIRNLQKFHHFDNVSHLKLSSRNDFSTFYMCNSLLYLTPMTFQNRHLLAKFININEGTQIAYVVLDEIHCLSNWGHDFRPEYLMLSKYLNKYLDRTTFLGFTATANYTVVEDIQKQLAIPQKNILSPISFEKYNVSYVFKPAETVDEMYSETCRIVDELIKRNERTIVFTKNDAISMKLTEEIGYEADVYQSDNPAAYHHFVDDKCKVLVTSVELGIGINLPNIKNIIHFGLPLSKNEYVQEIGRAGRANEVVTSYVVYLQKSSKNVPSVLLNRSTEVGSISDVLHSINNDYSDAYRKLNNNIDSKEELLA